MVLGHEMAHSVIGHTAEKLTRTSVIQARTNLLNNAIGNYSSSSECLASPNGTSMGCPSKWWCGICCWLVLPKGGVSQGILWWILEQVVTYVFELPFSRAQETEADEVCSSSSKGKRGRALSSLFILWDWDSASFVFYFYFPGGSSLCCQSLFWCEGSTSFLGCDATYGRGENSASRNCVHLYRLTNKGWGWDPGGPGPGDCGNFGFCINPPRWPKKAG